MFARGPAAHAPAQVEVLSVVDSDKMTALHLHITHIFCAIRSLSKASETLTCIGLKAFLWWPFVPTPFLTHKEVNSEDETKQFQFTLSPDKEKIKKQD